MAILCSGKAAKRSGLTQALGHTHDSFRYRANCPAILCGTLHMDADQKSRWSVQHAASSVLFWDHRTSGNPLLDSRLRRNACPVHVWKLCIAVGHLAHCQHRYTLTHGRHMPVFTEQDSEQKRCGLTIHSTRCRFAARVNSGVRPHRQIRGSS